MDRYFPAKHVFEYEATSLGGRRYAVRPKGCLGTCGWHAGVAWTVIYVNADSPSRAIIEARKFRPA